MDKIKPSANQFQQGLSISSAALNIQTVRIRTEAENMANVGSTSDQPGGDAYRQKTVTFESYFDKNSGTNLLRVGKVARDEGPQMTEYRPSHPSADDKGMIKVSGVDPMIVLMNMRDAMRSYQANLESYQTTMEMWKRNIELIKPR